VKEKKRNYCPLTLIGAAGALTVQLSARKEARLLGVRHNNTQAAPVANDSKYQYENHLEAKHKCGHAVNHPVHLRNLDHSKSAVSCTRRRCPTGGGQSGGTKGPLPHAPSMAAPSCSSRPSSRYQCTQQCLGSEELGSELALGSEKKCEHTKQDCTGALKPYRRPSLCCVDESPEGDSFLWPAAGLHDSCSFTSKLAYFSASINTTIYARLDRERTLHPCRAASRICICAGSALHTPPHPGSQVQV
jgi:hypothetical protein